MSIVSVIYSISLILKLSVLYRFRLSDLGENPRDIAMICLPAIVSLIDHRINGGLDSQQFHGIDLFLQAMVVAKVVVLLYNHKDHYIDRFWSFIKMNWRMAPSCY